VWVRGEVGREAGLMQEGAEKEEEQGRKKKNKK
jgi:hypothetical protein